MNGKDIKEKLGKIVHYRLPNSTDLVPFILNAYIFRVNPRNKKERLHQVELLDANSNCNNGSIVVAKLEDVILNVY